MTTTPTAQNTEAPTGDMTEEELINEAVLGIVTQFAINMMMEYQAEDKEDEEE